MANDIKVEKLTERNHALWAVKMSAFLKYKRLWSTIGSIIRAMEDEEATDASIARAHAAVDPERDEEALSLIILHISDHLLPLVSSCDTAFELWTALDRLAKSHITAQRYDLETGICRVEKKKSETIMAYFARIFGMRDALAMIGVMKEEVEICNYALRGLPDEYDSVRTTLLAQSAPLTLATVQSALLQVEAKKAPVMETDADLPEDMRATAFAATAARDRFANVECNYCHKKGHKESRCFKEAQVKKR